jgi:hypothetical protein
MDFGARKSRILAKERARKFQDERGLYCGRFNYMGAEGVARQNPQTFIVAVEMVKGVGTKEGYKESGKD